MFWSQCHTWFNARLENLAEVVTPAAETDESLSTVLVLHAVWHREGQAFAPRVPGVSNEAAAIGHVVVRDALGKPAARAVLKQNVSRDTAKFHKVILYNMPVITFLSRDRFNSRVKEIRLLTRLHGLRHSPL